MQYPSSEVTLEAIDKDEKLLETLHSSQQVAPVRHHYESQAYNQPRVLHVNAKRPYRVFRLRSTSGYLHAGNIEFYGVG